MSLPGSVTYDVVIAGAGPVGLFLACELRLANLAVLVLEQAQDANSPFKRPPFGIRGLSIPTLEALHRRGLLDAVSALRPSKDDAASAHWMRQARRPAGHFAGLQFFHDDIDVSKWPFPPTSPADAVMAVDMASLESVLAARAIASGVVLLRGVGVEGFDESDDGVVVRAGGDAFRARWLVGCDGGRSTVRKAAGFVFPGTDPEFTGYSVEVEMADPDALAEGRNYTPAGMYTYARPGTVAMVDFDGGAFHRRGPLTCEHVQEVLRRVSGADVTLTRLRSATTWTDRAQAVVECRKGRVLLAGDAAHIHSPLGGQGLNLGLGDAMNLGWKLAATIRGDAPPGLLDSYAAERRPVALQVLDWSRAQVALMRPTASSRALASIVRDLVATRDGAAYFASRVWGASLRYDLGGGHPLTGRSAPDIALSDGRSLAVAMRGGQGLLVDFAPGAPLRPLSGRWGDRLAYLADEGENRPGPGALLVRPDGVVAWAAEAAPCVAEAEQAAARWFGDPVEADGSV